MPHTRESAVLFFEFGSRACALCWLQDFLYGALVLLLSAFLVVLLPARVCVCVCVCVFEREKERLFRLCSSCLQMLRLFLFFAV